MKKPVKISLWLVVAAVFVAAGVFGYVWYTDNRTPNFSEDYVLYVYPDTPVSEVEDALLAGAGVKNPRSLSRALRKEEVVAQPGRYLIDGTLTSTYVARMLKFGWQTPQNLVIAGSVRTRAKVAGTIGRQMMVDSTAVANALTDNEFLAAYGVDSLDFFTIIIPDTYQMYWTASLEDIFARLRKEYDAFWTEERLQKAAKQGLSQHEVSILASIVQGETRRKEDYPIIAGVYLNRLRKGMKLQACPTVCYIFDYKISRVLNKHLAVDSPYNTYIYPGLPPTPICSPSKECLEAVLDPYESDYLYFCASPEFDGTHRYASTYSQHLANARAYQAALSKRNK